MRLWLSSVLLFFGETCFARVTTKEIITRRGYPVEAHAVVTDDGYILTLYRIPCCKNADDKVQKLPILLVHGLGGSSDNFITTTRALGYYLSDRGYDVWLGNCRGNRYSRKHVHLSPDYDEKFWDFSWHEIGVQDLPAMIDYILKETNQTRLYYVGHSQGTTSFFVMASERPDFNDKIILMSALAPSVFQSNIPQPFLQILSQFPDLANKLIRDFVIMEFLPINELISSLLVLICGEKFVLREICVNGFFLVAGPDSAQLNRVIFNAGVIPLLLSTAPAGASTKQFLHYGQLIISGRFRQYDYGVHENLFRYNSFAPPDYNLKNVIAPVAIFYGSNDMFVSKKDVDLLTEQLPNVVLKYLVPYKYFNHIDFAIAIDADKLVYDKMFEEMLKLGN